METNESNGPPLFVRLPLIIENHIIAFLRSFSVWRSRLILRIFPTRILLILEKTLLFHLSILLSTVSIIVSGIHI